MKNPAGGTQTIRGTAQSGVVFPAGSNAAAYISVLNGISGTINVRTLLNGAVLSQSNTTYQIGLEGNTAGHWYGVSTPEAFDGMEVEITDSQTQESREMRIIELCADHG